ncbi:MAG: hypoxanthine phosphoribosyltransferase [Coriobacteriia bacterium]|nr:hypoxanthine phosphoribosyltransferase [Coriobacteriia bacterium]
MHPHIDRILYTEEMIAQRNKEMGQAITEEYRDKVGEEGIVLVSVLRGAAIFMADLARCIDLPLEMDYMAVSSYGNGTTSSGRVRMLKDLSTDIEGRHVVIAEDILDSGLTLQHLLTILGQRKPASIQVVALLRKDTPNQIDIPCFQTGFVCPNEFVAGYGLDYAEHYRNLPYIGVLKPEVYAK